MAISGAAAGALLGAAGSVANSLINWGASAQLGSRARYENYKYGERAAENADRRTRALYNDIYSPGALLQQYQEAGLSPSLMFGGTPGQGGMQGARGTGAMGPMETYTPISLLEGAQAAALWAQAKKTNAEEKNLNADTALKKIQEEWQGMQKNEYKVQYTLTTTTVQDTEGKSTSLYELAGKSKNYNEFINDSRNAAEKSDNFELIDYMSTELGQRTMRGIYIAEKRFNTDIDVLSSTSENVTFQSDLLKAMRNKDFIDMNAEAAQAYLRANIQTAELTETQKEAWNNLISKLGEKGSTTRDIIVVLGMILNNAASNWHMPSIQGDHVTNNNIYQR